MTDGGARVRMLPAPATHIRCWSGSGDSGRKCAGAIGIRVRAVDRPSTGVRTASGSADASTPHRTVLQYYSIWNWRGLRGV